MNRVVDHAFDDWKARALEQDLLKTALGRRASLKRVGHEWVGPCPACGGRDRFSINTGKGVWNCRNSEGGSSVISMLMHIGGLSFTQACEELTGDPPPRGPSKPLTPEEVEQRARRRRENDEAQARRQEALERDRDLKASEAAAIFKNDVIPLSGTLGEAYLKLRGLAPPPMGWPLTIGFCPALIYKLDFSKPRYPALVGAIQDVAGEIVAIHAIFLDAKTSNKIQREESKLTYGPMQGGAIRLGEIGPLMNVDEGLETGIAIWSILDFREPVSATLGTSGLMNYEPPLEVEKVRGWMDGDRPIKKMNGIYVPSDTPPGRTAMLTLRSRMAQAGVGFEPTEEPPPGRDWLDIWNTYRKTIGENA